MSYGFEQLHYILELPFGSPAFLHDVQAPMPFARNPIYAVIHEACYASGVTTRWSAERVFPDDLRDDPTFLTGEHIYPWMFEDYGALAATRGGRADPRRARVARALRPAATGGERRPHGRRDLRRGHVRPSASFSEETAARIHGLRPWLTNEYEHDALRSNGQQVLGRLFDLVQGRA